MSWSLWPRRVVEASAEQIAATGAGYGYGAVDPLDGDTGYRRMGGGRSGAGAREVPQWTREKAVTASVAAYRSNPLAVAIVDTYTSFCVGDSGVKPECSNPEVKAIVDEFWNDPANNLGAIQELSLRSQLLTGEKLYELLVGPQSGAVRFCPIDPQYIEGISLRAGNPLWPAKARLSAGLDSRELAIAAVDDATGLRAGEAMFWAPWKTLDTDTRGMPFLTTVLDWLDSYDTVLSNLIDRTALARYLVWDVTVKGGQTEVDQFVASRGGLHLPQSGSIEVHNEEVTWEPRMAPSGSFEDVKANQAVLTSVAAGSGLAKTWLADPEDSNRATSQSMAEPVRRRVGGLQKVWLAQQTELSRYAVDRAVAAKRLPAKVKATDPRTGVTYEVPASQAVTVVGPEVAAADAQITAQVLLNLSTGLEKLVQIEALSPEAAAMAARKAWEDYVGVPYRHELARPDANPDDIATAVDAAVAQEAKRGGKGNPEALRRYWTKGSGLAKWVGTPHPWATLRRLLAEHGVPDDQLDETTSAWFHAATGMWPAERKGKNPVGPG